MAERTLTVRLRAIVDGYEKAMQSAARSTDDFAARADQVTGLGKRAEETGKRMTTGLTLPIAGVGAAALFTAGNFEASMREVQALTGATAGEMRMLEEQASRMGAETQFAASDAADALSQLIKGGFDVRQSYEALPGVMQLAAAATLDIASAADIATNVLSGFGLEVKDLGRVNDVLAQAANASDTDVRELGEAFKMVGPIARGAGMDLEDTTAVLAILAENGIRGTMAGTALRGMIGSLVAPTGPAADALERLGIVAVDANGELLPMVDIIEQLKDAGANSSDIYRIFGREVAGSMQAMVGTGAPALEKMTSLLEESGGVAQNLADAKMGGLNGSIEQLKGSLETLAIAVGDAGVLGFVGALADGATDLVNAMSGVPTPVMGGAAAILALAAATGPAIWGFGKMAQMYAPVTARAQDMVLKLMLMREQFQLARAAGTGTAAALGTAFGPQAAIIAGLVVLGGLLVVAKKEIDNYRRSHLQAGDSAVQMADAAGIATREISNLNEETDRGQVSTDDWRKSVEDTIITLRALGDEDLQQARLIEIGYQLVLRGATPDEAVQEVGRLAVAAGVEMPVDLNVGNVSDFDNQVEGAVARAKRAYERILEFSGSDQPLTKDIKEDLDGIAQAAADAWQTDNVAGFVEVLGAAGVELGGNADAMNYLVDQALKYSDVTGLSTSQAEGLAGALAQLSGDASGATTDQKDLVASIVETARGMEGGLTPANIAAAAAMRTAGYSATDAGERARDAASGSGEFADGMSDSADAAGDAAAASQEFADRVTQVAAKARLATIDIDANSAAAEAYASSIEGSSSADDLLAAGGAAGSALRSLREGLYGSADGADELEESADEAETAVDRLSDAASRLDEGLTAVGIRMGTLEAAADGFRRSLSDSSGLDDQLSSAIDLGDAWREYSKIVRRLPADLDLAAIASGKYRGRQAEAVQTVIDLGKASQEYLATLLETGAGEERVRGEAERLRGQYADQLRQVGMNEEQVRRYLEVLGLTPDQVETAITVSGEDAARFQIESYLQLLEGRIPENVAASVVTAIEGNDLEAAASQLASWARSNPARIEVKAEVDEESMRRTEERLWSLPANFDPLTAALGRYSEEQQNAIDGVLALGDAAQEYLGALIGAGETDTAREHAAALREEYSNQFAQLGLNQEQIDKYLDAMGLTPDQVETAIVLSGDSEAMFRIQTYTELLGEEIPPEVRTAVLAALDEGNLSEAADILTWWRNTEGSGDVTVGADTQPANDGVQTWFDWTTGLRPRSTTDVDTGPAFSGVKTWWDWTTGLKPTITVKARFDDAELRAGLLGWTGWFDDNNIPGGFGVKLPDGAQDGGADGDPSTPFRWGGRVGGTGSRISDNVHARLSPDEFVVRGDSAASLGYDRLDHANRTGEWPGMLSGQLVAAGGFNDTRLVDELRAVRAAVGTIKRGVTIEGDIVMPTTSPPRAAHSLLNGLDAEAWAQGYDV